MLHSAAIDIISDKLADRISRHTAGQSNVITDIAGLSFYRKDAPTECTTCFVEPSIALVVQGEKGWRWVVTFFTTTATAF